MSRETARLRNSAEIHNILCQVGANESQAADTVLHLTNAERLKAVYLAARYRAWRQEVMDFADGVRERRLQDEASAET